MLNKLKIKRFKPRSYLAGILVVGVKNFVWHPSNLLDLAGVLLAVNFFVEPSNVHNRLVSDRPFLIQHTLLKFYPCDL